MLYYNIANILNKQYANNFLKTATAPMDIDAILSIMTSKISILYCPTTIFLSMLNSFFQTTNT